MWSLIKKFPGSKSVERNDSPQDQSLIAMIFHLVQVDYILGNNNRGLSYLVGFGNNYPQRVHHRASSIVAYKKNPEFVACKAGYANWYNIQTPNPNLLVGAVVGGPDQNDDFIDQRDAYLMTEPATYNTAPLVGVLARLQSGSRMQNVAGIIFVNLPPYLWFCVPRCKYVDELVARKILTYTSYPFKS